MAAIIAVIIMYAMIFVGVRYPLELPYMTWVWILIVYMVVATRLPVWLLVQPRDFINGLQLVIALVICTVGVIALTAVGEGAIAAPAIRIAPEGAPPIWPFVMITIACGAISGWHSLVGSGTTPKQLQNEKQARMVGYGSMLGEGYLAVIALLTAVVGLGVAGYAEMYDVWGAAAWPRVWADGGSTFLVPLGIPAMIGAAYFAVVVKSFAMTTLDSAMRFTRIATAEFSQTVNLPKIFTDRTVSMIPGLIVIILLATSGHGMVLWPLFGATNQILAALALLAAAVFLLTLRRATIYYIIPFVIMIVSSMVAMAYSVIMQYIPAGNWELVIIGIIVFLCGLGVVIVAINTWSSKKKELGM